MKMVVVALMGFVTFMFVMGGFFIMMERNIENRNTHISFACGMTFEENDTMPLDTCNFSFKGNPNQIIKMIELVGEIKRMEAGK